MNQMKDITFTTNEGVFNYRVCALILNEKKVLAMHDERLPYYYLPGGRVGFHETAEKAILREIEEELGIYAKIDKAVWLNQNFFTEDVSKEKYHELCIYYLLDVSGTSLLERGEKFVVYEGMKKLEFEWLAFERLKQEYIYPLFIKDKIFCIPHELTIITEQK